MKQHKEKGGILLFESWHGKHNVGSSRIRGHWLVKNWPELEVFKQGQEYSFIIFQKCYWPQFANKFDGVKILDICDADWLETQPVKAMIDEVDAITCSTNAITDYIKQLTNKPVLTIPDRQDLEFLDKPKVHKGKAKSVVWFGYAHNAKVLDVVVGALKRYKLKLTVISELRPPYSKADENVKWELDTVNKNIRKHDIVLMPQKEDGRFAYKSNNKIINSWALGMPVATNPDELKRFIDPDERNKEVELRFNEVKEKWDVKLSVKELQNLIEEIKNGKAKIKD